MFNGLSDLIAIQCCNHICKSNTPNSIKKNRLTATKVKCVRRKMMIRRAEPLIKGFQYQNIWLVYHFRQYIKVNTHQLNYPLIMFPAHTDEFYLPFYPKFFEKCHVIFLNGHPESDFLKYAIHKDNKDKKIIKKKAYFKIQNSL